MLGDHDDAGKKFARRVEDALRSFGVKPDILDPRDVAEELGLGRDIPEGWDLADVLPFNGGGEEAGEPFLRRAAPPPRPSSPPTCSPTCSTSSRPTKVQDCTFEPPPPVQLRPAPVFCAPCALGVRAEGRREARRPMPASGARSPLHPDDPGGRVMKIDPVPLAAAHRGRPAPRAQRRPRRAARVADRFGEDGDGPPTWPKAPRACCSSPPGRC